MNDWLSGRTLEQIRACHRPGPHHSDCETCDLLAILDRDYRPKPRPDERYRYLLGDDQPAYLITKNQITMMLRRRYPEQIETPHSEQCYREVADELKAAGLNVEVF